MSYTIQSSEKTKSIGSDFETKALLYLMNFRDDSHEIHYFVIDFFNDLTGLDRLSNKSWDLQSKAAKKNFQGDIGKELVTLYKNYSSSFSFDHYILFLGGIADSIRLDNSKNIFDICNIKSQSLTKIENSLLKECIKKTYITAEKASLTEIKKFLTRVIFVIDDKEKSEYIKSIIKVNPLIIPSDTVLEQIFNQIRDVQSSKKNNNMVEGIVLQTKDEFIFYNRHLTNQEIKMMVLNRIINNNILQRGVTPSFIPVFNRIPATEQKDMLEDCQHSIARTIFDKNNSENFWNLFNDIYEIITSNKTLSIDLAYRLVNRELLEKLPFLNMISVIYFMAVIKDGIYDN
ncbi:hypothetical protein E8L90_04760 [Brevibacillus antibioticus]|uniref:DUF4297 domain-containing protein n=1 Tax=Brevibacillus antibioticus TaxID=2570228 RepID=A0A4U2Y453_9BACL|nr:hypothetical protein [Brevibacillus antibioticus]TKI54805.1 hypothetical protein E8L90_04760 [Brevibacillus antibioticus]